jgi:Flp pilus assembly protein TadG
MSQHAGAHGRLAKFRGLIAGAAADQRGVAAIEFAMLVPLLLCMYFVTMEVSQAIETNKKVSRIGSMVADLVTQQQTTTKAELDAIMTIGQSLLTPYHRSKPKIVITAIEITDEATPQVKVYWSRKLVNDVYSADLAKGTIITVPTTLKTRGSFLVRVESYLDYKPVITWAASNKATLGLTASFDSISMKEAYYLRPRMSSQVSCSDC